MRQISINGFATPGTTAPGIAVTTIHLVRADRALSLPAKDGLSSGHPLQILADDRGSIWVTGERGITRLMVEGGPTVAASLGR